MSLHPLIIPCVLTVLFTTASAAEPTPQPLAHFTFNGHANPETPDSAVMDLRFTEFKDNAVFLNGKYEFGPEAKGYHAVCRIPSFEFTAWTVAIRFKAQTFNTEKSNLITGGTKWRWFGLERSEAGNLVVTFNNGAFKKELPDSSLKAGEWTVVACGVDLPSKKVVAWRNGKRAGEFTLPDDFKLDVAAQPPQAQDKEWSFVNYSNTNLFHGLVDELIVHNRLLSAAEAEAEFRRMPLTSPSLADMPAGTKADFLSHAEQELLDLTNRERFLVRLPPLKPNRQLTQAARGHAANMARQQILNHTLDGKKFNERIEATGYRLTAAGENISNGTNAAEAIADWMQSPGHRQNILNAEYKDIGLGIGTSESGRKYWTLVFAAPDSRTPPKSTPPAQPKKVTDDLHQ